MCGEQLVLDILQILYRGSPPRVRGTGRYHGLYIELKRITPACAGNRCCLVVKMRPGEDHPRVCGEQIILGNLLATF